MTTDAKIRPNKKANSTYGLASNIRQIKRHKMQWICEESGATYSYPLEEVVGKVHCIGCGKTHHLKRGELNNQDKRQLEKIAEEAKENKALIDIIGVISETDYIHWHIRGDDFSSG